MRPAFDVLTRELTRLGVVPTSVKEEVHLTTKKPLLAVYVMHPSDEKFVFFFQESPEDSGTLDLRNVYKIHKKGALSRSVAGFRLVVGSKHRRYSRAPAALAVGMQRFLCSDVRTVGEKCADSIAAFTGKMRAKFR